MTLLEALADHVRKRDLRRALLEAPPAPDRPAGDVVERPLEA